jgi:hypothetical protein
MKLHAKKNHVHTCKLLKDINIPNPPSWFFMGCWVGSSSVFSTRLAQPDIYVSLFYYLYFILFLV